MSSIVKLVVNPKFLNNEKKSIVHQQCQCSSKPPRILLFVSLCPSLEGSRRYASGLFVSSIDEPEKPSTSRTDVLVPTRVVDNLFHSNHQSAAPGRSLFSWHGLIDIDGFHGDVRKSIGLRLQTFPSGETLSTYMFFGLSSSAIEVETPAGLLNLQPLYYPVPKEDEKRKTSIMSNFSTNMLLTNNGLNSKRNNFFHSKRFCFQNIEKNAFVVVSELVVPSYWAFKAPSLLYEAWARCERRSLDALAYLAEDNLAKTNELKIVRERLLEKFTKRALFFDELAVKLIDQILSSFPEGIRPSILKNIAPHSATINCIVHRMNVGHNCSYSIICFGAAYVHFSDCPGRKKDNKNIEEGVEVELILKKKSFLIKKLRSCRTLFDSAFLSIQKELENNPMVLNSLKNIEKQASNILKGALELLVDTEVLRDILKQVKKFADFPDLVIRSSIRLADYSKDLLSQISTILSKSIDKNKGVLIDFPRIKITEEVTKVLKEAEKCVEGAFALLFNERRKPQENNFDNELSNFGEILFKENTAFAQCFGAVLTGFIETLGHWLEEVQHSIDFNEKLFEFWNHWAEFGWLCQFESLLSATGKELEMLQSFNSSLERIERSVIFYLVRGKSVETEININLIMEDKDFICVNIILKPKFYDKIEGANRHVKPFVVLVTQGINEQQTISRFMINRDKGSEFQHLVNVNAAKKLREYWKSLVDELITKKSRSTWYSKNKNNQIEKLSDYNGKYIDLLVERRMFLQELLSQLDAAINQNKRMKIDLLPSTSSGTMWLDSKNTDILVLAALITRILGSPRYIFSNNQSDGNCLMNENKNNWPQYGAHPSTSTRFTSCKSAKDRTAMSATLEFTYILLSSHGLPSNNFESFLSALRVAGVRLCNVNDNVGTPYYAFNKLQRNLLPPFYRPPKHSINQKAPS